MKVYLKNKETVQFQIGVDVLGFPIFHQHILLDVLEKHNTTGASGKNKTKNKVVFKEVAYCINNQFKQH